MKPTSVGREESERGGDQLEEEVAVGRRRFRRRRQKRFRRPQSLDDHLQQLLHASPDLGAEQSLAKGWWG